MSGMIATITDYVSERVADGKDALVNFKDAPVESLTCLPQPTDTFIRTMYRQ